ncbi:hypothetical protein Ddye_030273 [Dipteronia dyeriana]|uniref:Endonuclease/exonuclease/phosphatase domain-containing protein n=1 Tax=Dipteronia dyeriana TaxID=168575 RepID=A0AAD9TGT3_9ROSI|nr:hypothetical protein Ddye_030273 [Dipteronia dyeriana]
MKILCWNVRGLRSIRAFQVLLRVKKVYQPDVLFLMETKVDHGCMENIRVKLGFGGKLVVNSERKKGGLCLLWRDGADISLLSYSKYHIDVQVLEQRMNPWRLTGFYGHPVASQRHYTWTLLRRLRDMSSLPWVYAGDFNEILEVRRSWAVLSGRIY